MSLLTAIYEDGSGRPLSALNPIKGEELEKLLDAGPTYSVRQIKTTRTDLHTYHDIRVGDPVSEIQMKHMDS